MQEVFFEIMKRFRGEHLGSMLSGVFELMGGAARADADNDFTLDSIFGVAVEQGLGGAVKDNDSKFPSEWRLSTSGRTEEPKRKRKR